MEKYITPASYEFDQPVASLIPLYRKGVDRDWLVKRAADAVAMLFDDLVVPPGHSAIHVIAMGASDRYGANRNGDDFYKTARRLELPLADWKDVVVADGTRQTKSASTFTDRTETGLLDQHHTFTTHGDVYRHHRNRKSAGDKVWGKVAADVYNHPMERVELALLVKNAEWSDDLQTLASGGDVDFSMSAYVAHDVCSACGHKANSRSKYCPHLKRDLTTMLKSGHVVSAVNERPVFFDISRVGRRADRIALGLLSKAAAYGRGELNQAPPISAAGLDPLMLAEAHPGPVGERLRLLEKAAAMEQLMRTTLGKSESLNTEAGFSHAWENVGLPLGNHFKLAQVLRALSDQDVCLPLDGFAALWLGKDEMVKQAAMIQEAMGMLPFAFEMALADPLPVVAGHDFAPDGAPQPHLAKQAMTLAADFAMNRYAFTNRMVRRIINDQGSRMVGWVKRASHNPAALELLQHYTAYKLSFLNHSPQRDDQTMNLVVLQNLV